MIYYTRAYGWLTRLSCVSGINVVLNVVFACYCSRGHFNQDGLTGDLLRDSGYV